MISERRLVVWQSTPIGSGPPNFVRPPGTDGDNFPPDDRTKNLSVLLANGAQIGQDFKGVFNQSVGVPYTTDDGIPKQAYSVYSKTISALPLLQQGYKSTDAWRALFKGPDGQGPTNEFDFNPMTQITVKDLTNPSDPAHPGLIDDWQEEITELTGYTKTQHDNGDIDDNTFNQRNTMLGTYQKILDTLIKPLAVTMQKHADVLSTLVLNK
jgi:hypothetical protein